MLAIPTSLSSDKLPHLLMRETMLSSSLHMVVIFYAKRSPHADYMSSEQGVVTDPKTFNGQWSLNNPGMKTLLNKENRGIGMQEIQRESEIVLMETEDMW